MRKLIFILSLLFIVLGVSAQLTHHNGVILGTNGSPIDSAKVVGSDMVFYSGGVAYSTGSGTEGGDSIFITVQADTFYIAGTNFKIYKDADTLMFEDPANGAIGLNELINGGSGSYLLISDTAAMLEPYLLEEDTAAMLTNYPVTGEYVAPGDTASMLDPYLTEASAASTYEVQLNNEAGLYAVLSDVTQFLEPGDSPTLLDGTAHRIFYTDGSGNVTELAFGTDGQVLTSTGASTAPAFEDAAGGSSVGDTLTDHENRITDLENWQADTIPIDTVAVMLVDTTHFSFGFGLGNTGDTLSCQVDAVLGYFFNEQDSIPPRIVRHIGFGLGTPSIGVGIYYDENYLDATPTTVWTGTVTGTGASSTTFSVNAIPPNVYVWAKITTVTSKMYHAAVSFGFSRKRAP